MAMVIKGVASQNGQCDEEKAREVYIDALSMAEVAQVLEAEKLGEYLTLKEIKFCSNMAKMYGCKPLETDGDNLINFLVTLYHYGRVQGIRQERARRKKKRDRELVEIAKTLEGNPLLYQVMKTAAELEDKSGIKKAVEFLKGAKKNED